MLAMTGFTQLNNSYFMPGERLPDIPLSRIINYKDSVGKLSDFQGKLIIIDFWSIHCSPCVAEFPLMDSIQKNLGDKVQLLLVTYDPKEKVVPFLAKWEEDHHTKFSVPIIYGDMALNSLFPHYGNPCKVWISTYGKFMTLTNERQLFNYDTVKNRANELVDYLAQLKRDLPPSAYEFKTPKDTLNSIMKNNTMSFDGWSIN